MTKNNKTIIKSRFFASAQDDKTRKQILRSAQDDKKKFRMTKGRSIFLFAILLLCLFIATYFIARYYFSRQSNQILSSLSSSTPIISVTSSNKLSSSTPSPASSTLISSIISFFSAPAPTPSPSATLFPLPPTTSATLLPPGSNLFFGTYIDNFSNSVYIDQSHTSLYRDDISTAVFFPPVYDWKNADSSSLTSAANYFSGLSFNDFSGPYNDKRCLGNNCLELKSNSLYYNGQTLSLPFSLKTAKVAAVSISALTNRWLVGITIKEGEKNYRGRVFYFDGSKFTEIITPAPVVSTYFGPWGFGGEESDFLIIYGAYQGIAYRVRGHNLTDISRFFSYREMNGGFKAEVIKTVFGSNINWYVYSSTLDRPRFFKLWQNRGPEIVGEVFFPDFFNNAPHSAAFKFENIGTDHISLLAKIVDKKGNFFDKIFTDRGFNNTTSGFLTTTALGNSGVGNEIIIKYLALAKLNLDVGSQSLVQYLFSLDGQNWREFTAQKNVEFVTPAFQSFYLKVIFPAFNDKFSSPYLDSIIFNYYNEIVNTSSVVEPVIVGDTANENINNKAKENPVTPPVIPPVNQPPAAPLIPPDAIRIKVSAAGFVPNIFTIKAGQSVTLALTSTDNNAHVFIFPRASLMALTTMVLGNEIKTVTFTAPAPGIYEFRDDIPAYRQNVGEMVVK